MKIKREWYTIKEAESIANLPSNDILYLAAYGRIELGYDWVLIQEELSRLNLNSGIRFYQEQETPPFQSAIVDAPDYVQAPLNRIATIHCQDLFSFLHTGQAKIMNANVDGKQLCTSMLEYVNDNSPATIKTEQLIITADNLAKLDILKVAEPSEMTHQERKQSNNSSACVGTMLKMFEKTSEYSDCFENGNLNASKFARRIESNLPDDDTGLSFRNIRKILRNGELEFNFRNGN